MSLFKRISSHLAFSWRRERGHHYRLNCGDTEHGRMTLFPEQSILFSPTGYDHYRAEAEVADRRYTYRCMYKENQFSGCIAVEDGSQQPIFLFEDVPATSVWRSRSHIILCDEGTTLPWLYGEDRKRCVALSQGERVLELSSAAPEEGGTVYVNKRALLSSFSPALVSFCAYLAIGPKRAASSTAQNQIYM